MDVQNGISYFQRFCVKIFVFNRRNWQMRESNRETGRVWCPGAGADNGLVTHGSCRSVGGSVDLCRTTAFQGLLSLQSRGRVFTKEWNRVLDVVNSWMDTLLFIFQSWFAFTTLKQELFYLYLKFSLLQYFFAAQGSQAWQFTVQSALTM